jgi:hypothetical protein
MPPPPKTPVCQRPTMESAYDAEHLNLVRVTPSGNGVRDAVKDLDQHFDFDDTAGGRGRSELKGSLEASKALSAVRAAFWAEFEKSEKVSATFLLKTHADVMCIKA